MSMETTEDPKPLDGRRSTLAPLSSHSLVASAKRISSEMVKDRQGFGKPESWQEDAWDMYDLVGEQRFLATTLAGRVSQAKLFVGKVGDDPIEPPEPLDTDEHIAARAFATFGGTPTARAQMVARLALNMFVAGDGWLVGVPKHLMPGFRGDRPTDPLTGDDVLGEANLEDLDWKMMSVTEVQVSKAGSTSGAKRDGVTLHFGEGEADRVTTTPDDIVMIRVWRPHPRKAWLADSPTRSSLPVLRELVGLTMHISAQTDSRLAGAGVFIVPQSAKRAIAAAQGLDPDGDDDPFTEALMEAMMTAISDRSSAAALVPLVVVVPDESTGLFQHISFSTPLDMEARNLRDEAIRRLALGQDAPPELLLGTGGMNHWGAWLVREDVVTTHVEPPLALICDAITTQFLWPVLMESGMTEEEAQQYVVWYDVSHMVMRPNRLADANALHDKGVVGDETLREAAGFTDADAPEKLNRSVELAIQMATANPALVDNLPEIIAAFEAVLNPDATQQAALEDATNAPEVDLTAGEDQQQTSETGDDNTPLQEDTAGEPGPGQLSVRLATPEEFNELIEAKREALNGVFADMPDGPAFVEGYIANMQEQYAALAAKQEFAAKAADVDDSVVIVARPANADALPGPEDKHATLLYFGHAPAQIPDNDVVKALLCEATAKVASVQQPFSATVSSLEPLGDEGAQVWHLECTELAACLTDILEARPEVQDIYDQATAEGVTRYEEFTAHVTVGYDSDEADEPLTDDNLDEASQVQSIEFDALEVWWKGEKHTFLLGEPYDEELAVDESLLALPDYYSVSKATERFDAEKLASLTTSVLTHGEAVTTKAPSATAQGVNA